VLCFPPCALVFLTRPKPSRQEDEALAEEREYQQRAERRLREEEDRQISAAVYSLEPVTTEESMYQSHEEARERELTVTPRYSLEQQRVGGREWSHNPAGKQWVSYFSETQCGKDDAPTVTRVLRNLNPDNPPVERQAAVRMLAKQVREGHIEMTKEFLGLLQDHDMQVQRLAFEALSWAVNDGKDAALAAAILLLDKAEASLRLYGIKALETVALRCVRICMCGIHSCVWWTCDYRIGCHAASSHQLLTFTRRSGCGSWSLPMFTSYLLYFLIA